MKARWGNHGKKLVAIGFSALALLLVVRSILGLGYTDRAITPRTTHEASTEVGENTHKSAGSSDPTLRLSRLELAEIERYHGTGRNIFQMLPVNDEPSRIHHETSGEPPRTRDPVAEPDIPLKFFGFAATPGTPKKVFLSDNGDVFIGSEGDIVDRRYRIVKVGTTSIDVQDLIQESMHKLSLSIG
jgi:hypothetical protein